MDTIYTKYFPELTKQQLSKFNDLKQLIGEWNEKINVISRNPNRSIEVEHVLHSLSIACFMHFKPNTEILDFGTGGGFPGIPLAIFFPNTQFHLVDSIAKKIKVVSAIANELSLSNVSTQVVRAEGVDRKFDFISCRAVGRMSKILPWVKDKIHHNHRNDKQNGFIFLKGGDLSTELDDVGMQYERIPLSTYFNEPFFETKEIVYLSPDLNKNNKK